MISKILLPYKDMKLGFGIIGRAYLKNNIISNWITNSEKHNKFEIRSVYIVNTRYIYDTIDDAKIELDKVLIKYKFILLNSEEEANKYRILL